MKVNTTYGLIILITGDNGVINGTASCPTSGRRNRRRETAACGDQHIFIIYNIYYIGTHIFRRTHSHYLELLFFNLYMTITAERRYGAQRHNIISIYKFNHL